MEVEGFCECGCGERTRLAPSTDRRKGWVKGRPMRYVAGHNRRSSPVEYTEDPATGCWVWQRHRSAEGYGRISTTRNRESKTFYAHRIYYERAKGPIPEGLHIDHLCRNRACVNPDHLEPVTCRENARRGARQRLTATEHSEIRTLRAQGWRCRDIGEAYGVSHPYVSAIGRGVY